MFKSLRRWFYKPVTVKILQGKFYQNRKISYENFEWSGLSLYYKDNCLLFAREYGYTFYIVEQHPTPEELQKFITYLKKFKHSAITLNKESGDARKEAENRYRELEERLK